MTETPVRSRVFSLSITPAPHQGDCDFFLKVNGSLSCVSHPPRVALEWTKWTGWTRWTKTFTAIDLHIHTPKECFIGNASCLLHIFPAPLQGDCDFSSIRNLNTFRRITPAPLQGDCDLGPRNITSTFMSITPAPLQGDCDEYRQSKSTQ